MRIGSPSFRNPKRPESNRKNSLGPLSLAGMLLETLREDAKNLNLLMTLAAILFRRCDDGKRLAYRFEGFWRDVGIMQANIMRPAWICLALSLSLISSRISSLLH